MNPQVEALVRQLLLRVPSHESVAHAAETFLKDIPTLGGVVTPALRSNVDLAVKEVERRLGPVEVLTRISLASDRERWYFGPQSPPRPGREEGVTPTCPCHPATPKGSCQRS